MTVHNDIPPARVILSSPGPVGTAMWAGLSRDSAIQVVHCLYFNGDRERYETAFPRSTNLSNEELFRRGVTGAFEDVDLRQLTPEFLAQCAWAEPTALKMMDRLVLPEIDTYSARLNLFRYLLAHWSRTITDCQASAYFMETEPHEVADFTLFVVAKALGIATSILIEMPSLGRSVLASDYRQPWRIVPPPEQEIEFNGQECAEDLLSKLRQDYTSARPAYMQHNEDLASVRSVQAKLRTILRRGLRVPRRTIMGSRIHQQLHSAELLAREYRALAVIPDTTRPYIYFCLQFQPEKTTSPCAGIFVDQYLAVALIASCLPPGWRILVKEHPGQYWTGPFYGFRGRDPAYYRRLRSIPGVQFVSLDSDHFRLIDGAAAVATATGTVGWEALARGVPALVFGEAWFSEAPGAFPIRTHADCCQAIAVLESARHVADPDHLTRFLVDMIVSSVPVAMSELASKFYGQDWNLDLNTAQLRRVVVPWLLTLAPESPPNSPEN